MSSLKNLYRLLQPLRIYALHGDSLIDCELSAYGAGFDIICDMLREARDDCFIQTAREAALALHERASGLPVRETAPEHERRELLLARRRPPSSGDGEGLREELLGTGLISPEAAETPEGSIRLSVKGIAAGISADAAVGLAAKILPAHIGFEIPGPSWNELDVMGLSWDSFDAQDISWTHLELFGPN